jgi:hypothetical protein
VVAVAADRMAEAMAAARRHFMGEAEEATVVALPHSAAEAAEVAATEADSLP